MKPELNYRDPEFYGDEYRSKLEVIDRVKVNTLPTLHTVREFYEVHMFNDGYIAVFNTVRNRYLKPHIGDESSYYFRYGLRTIHNKSKTTYMHRLVGLGWVDGWEEDMVIDHKDTDQLNNLKGNLEWVISEINTKRAVANGLGVGRPKVEKVIKPKLTLLERSEASSKGLSYDKVDEIFDLAENGYSVSDIARELNVTQPCISQIISGKRWKEHPRSIEYFSKKELHVG